VGIAASYRLDGWNSSPGRSKRFFSSPQLPEGLWDPLSVLSDEYWGLLSCGQNCRGLKLTTHPHLVRKSRMVELNVHSSIYLHGVVLN
jgi:hypothetical protein